VFLVVFFGHGDNHVVIVGEDLYATIFLSWGLSSNQGCELRGLRGKMGGAKFDSFVAS
jgi:hypothetical protein